MRILMTGGSGVLGRASIPLLRQAGHHVDAPRHDELDLYDQRAVTAAARDIDAILHLVSRTPPPEARGRRDAWAANDRLRRDATGILVDAALTTGVECFLFPSLAFIYPPTGPVDESTPLPEDVYEIARSAVDGEQHVDRFSSRGGRGVVLRLECCTDRVPTATTRLNRTAPSEPPWPSRTPAEPSRQHCRHRPDSTTSSTTANGYPTLGSSRRLAGRRADA